jgi:TonB family protein
VITFVIESNLFDRRRSHLWLRWIRNGPVSFHIEDDGQVSKLKVERSGGNFMDQAALNAVNDAGPFPALPPEASKSLEFVLTLPVRHLRTAIHEEHKASSIVRW